MLLQCRVPLNNGSTWQGNRELGCGSLQSSNVGRHLCLCRSCGSQCALNGVAKLQGIRRQSLKSEVSLWRVPCSAIEAPYRDSRGLEWLHTVAIHGSLDGGRHRHLCHDEGVRCGPAASLHRVHWVCKRAIGQPASCAPFCTQSLCHHHLWHGGKCSLVT